MMKNLEKEALKKLRKAQAEVMKARKLFKAAKNESKAATFQIEFIKRKGHLEEIFWRVPHIGEMIFDQLDNQSLTKCREVNRWWKIYIDSLKKFVYIRQIQFHICISNESVRNRLQKETVQTLKEFESFSSMESMRANKRTKEPTTIEKRRNQFFLSLALNSENLDDPTVLGNIMLENMKNKNPLDHFENTALHEAAYSGNLSMFKLILNYSENISPRNKVGYTPLHNAARQGQYEMCKFIIEHVQDLNPMSCSKETPFNLAENEGHKKICELLKSAQLKENQKPRNPRKKRRL